VWWQVEGNPCAEDAAGDDLVIELMAVLPNLRTVDGMEVEEADRRAAQMVRRGCPLLIDLLFFMQSAFHVISQYFRRRISLFDSLSYSC
jgi:hypothetical protein